MGLLDHYCKRILQYQGWVKQAQKIAACAKLPNRQLECSHPCLTVQVAIAKTLGKPEAIPLAIAHAGLHYDHQRHQPLNREADDPTAKNRHRRSSKGFRETKSCSHLSVMSPVCFQPTDTTVEHW